MEKRKEKCPIEKLNEGFEIFRKYDTTDPSNIMNNYVSDNPEGRRIVADITDSDELPVVLTTVAHANDKNEGHFIAAFREYVKLRSDKDATIKKIVSIISLADHMDSDWSIERVNK